MMKRNWYFSWCDEVVRYIQANNFLHPIEKFLEMKSVFPINIMKIVSSLPIAESISLK